MRPVWTCFIGVMLAVVLNKITSYYTHVDYAPVKSLAKNCQTGHATNIIQGFAIGYESTVVAIADQMAGHDLGFINPALYSIALNPAQYDLPTALKMMREEFKYQGIYLIEQGIPTGPDPYARITNPATSAVTCPSKMVQNTFS